MSEDAGIAAGKVVAIHIAKYDGDPRPGDRPKTVTEIRLGENGEIVSQRELTEEEIDKWD